MVDTYLNCTRKGCDGVMVRQGTDTRSKNLKFVCSKCAKTENYARRSFEAGRHTFSLNDPNDPLRSGTK
jgi:hypothetical protein